MAMAHDPGYSVITMSHWCRQLVTIRLLLILPGCCLMQRFFASLWPLTPVTPRKPHEGVGPQARHGNGSLRIRSLGPRASCSRTATATIITVVNPRPVSAAQTTSTMISSSTSTKTRTIRYNTRLIRAAHPSIAWPDSLNLAAQTATVSSQYPALPTDSYPVWSIRRVAYLSIGDHAGVRIQRST